MLECNYTVAYYHRQSCMQSMRKLRFLVPGLLTCNCDGVVMSHDVKLRCERIRSRFQAANNLACHGTSPSEVCGLQILPLADPGPREFKIRMR